MTTMSKSTLSPKALDGLLRFLRTYSGRNAVAAYVGVRATDPALAQQARENALFWCTGADRRQWTLRDLEEHALIVRQSGLWAAREVAK